MVSTCVYLTNSHQDARLIEHWLIREIGPELNRTNRNHKSGSKCDLRCAKNCEAWDTPGKTLKFGVDILANHEGILPNSLHDLPKKPGVYVITTESGKQYVGSSSNICSRVREHSTLKGENITERIQSVRCDVTMDRVDAYILEYFRIRQIEPELNREFREDAWTWKSAELARHFDRRPDLEPLFKSLSSAIHARIPEIEEIVRKDRVTYRTAVLRNIFFVKFMSRCLRIDLKDKDHKIDDPSEFSWTIEPKQTDVFHRRLELCELADVDRALAIIAQACEHMS